MDQVRTQLVLSLFPGVGLLDAAFEEEGFCVVRGPDVLWGGDVRKFFPPAGRFDGVIGGPPCQCFSRLAGMVRQNGYRPRFGNLIPEFERCIKQARPLWFLMENVPDAPVPEAPGYGIHSFTLNNRQVGATQRRVRRWSFGWLQGRRPLCIETVALEPFEFEYAAFGRPTNDRRPRTLNDYVGLNLKTREAFAHIRRSQGLPESFELPPFRIEAACQALRNGVPLPMGRAMARAVRRAIEQP